MIKMILKKILEESTFLGGLLFYLLFSFWFLFRGRSDYFFVLISGLMIIYLSTVIIRIFYFKDRPNKMAYKNFMEKIDASSFPSVHGARITFIFIFLTLNMLKSFFLVFLSFIVVLLVIYSRIYLKKHYFIDLLGGIILGLFAYLISFAL
jgi:membrane-associated phospholipid phosphatase